MSYERRVREARTPQEALIVLAEGIDRVLAAVGDGWTSGWRDADTPAEMPRDDEREETARQLREQIAQETDPEERKVLEARLHLLLDDGKSIQPTRPPGERLRVTVDGRVSEVELPVADTETQERRRQFAKQIGLQGEMIEHYAKGGPLWLYIGNRDYVMGLPEPLRRQMVKDVIQTAPAEAQAFGRDVLKDPESGAKSFDHFVRIAKGEQP